MYPRAMNNKEKEGFKIVKDSGLAYELGWINLIPAGGYVVSVPKLCGTYFLEQYELFVRDAAKLTNNN